MRRGWQIHIYPNLRSAKISFTGLKQSDILLCLLTETNINSRLAKTRTAIDRLSVIWKSDLTDKIKCSFFQTAVVWRKSLTAITQECCEQYKRNLGGSTQKSSSCTATYHISQKLSKLDEPDMRETAGEAGTNS